MHFLVDFTAKQKAVSVEIKNRVVIVQSPQSPTDLVQHLCGFHAVIVQWLCHSCEVLSICMPNVYSFSFLIEMTPKTEGGKAMRSKKLKADPLQFARPYGHGVVPMKLLMTAQYPCNFTGTSRTPCSNLAIAMQVQYNYFKSRAYNHCAILFCPK